VFKFLKINILFFILFSLTSFDLLAETRFWVAADDGTTKYYDDTANWSNTSGGNGGFSAPTRDDIVKFDGGSSVTCTIRRGANALQLKIVSSFNGTVKINANKTLRVASHIAIYSGGTLEVGSNSQLFMNAATSRIYSGGVLSAANAKKVQFSNQSGLEIKTGGIFSASSNQTVFKGGFRNYGTFTHNNGTVIFAPSNHTFQVVTGGTGTGKEFYNVIKNGKNRFRMNGDMQVNNFRANKGIWNVDGNDLYIKGNYTVNSKNRQEHNQWSTPDGSTSVIFNGTSDQTIIAYDHNNNFPSFENLTITNTSGIVSFANHAVGIDGTLTINSGATLDIEGNNFDATTLVNNGTLKLQGGETITITNKDTDSGTITYDGSGSYTDLEYGDDYYNLTFNSTGTFALDANLNVDGALTITDGTLDVTSDNRSINVAGNWTNADIFKSRSGTVTFDGTSTITSGGITDTQHDFYNVILSGSAGTQSTNHVDVDNDFTISSSGTWDTGGLCLFVAGTTTTGSGTLTNTTLPTVTFDPANSDNDVQPSENITLTFNHAMRNTDDSALTNTNIDSLITLKVNNSSGADIAFDATIDSDKKVITINPNSNLTGQQNVYVAIGATVEDQTCEQAITAANATFTVVDTDVPTLTSSTPADGAIEVGVNDNIVLNFSKAVDAESGNIVIYKSSDDSEVESIPVGNAKVSGSGSTEITINPATTLDSLTGYYVQIAATAFDDSSSNSYAGITDTTTLNFTTADVEAPTLTFSPLDSATGIADNTNITITFDEAIRNTDNSELTDTNVDSLITLKETNSSGSNIDFDATIDSDKKIITINPDSDFSSAQVIYVAIGATVEDSSDNAISASNITFTVAAPTSPPSLTFSPSDNSASIAVDTNITITFDKAIRHIDNTDITDTNIDSLITLRKTNSSGVGIPFNATIDSTNKVITINPSSNFSSSQVVYVAIGAAVEDYYNNAISSSSITFTVVDTAAPTITFNPSNSDTDVTVSSNITLTFNEAIRNTNNTALTDSNVDSLITLKDSDEDGDNISFDATIDSDKKIITINPDSNFSSEQIVYMAIGATVEDSSDNAITATDITFTAADSTPPTLTFTPADSDTGIAINSDITIAFNESVRNIDNSTLTDANVDSLITLKQTNANGSNIDFEAVINTDKKLITITPDNSFSSEQVVYVAIGATVEDESDNAISASSITFTSADATAPVVTFDPADTSTGIPITANVTLTFNEAVRNTNDSELTNSNVGSLITLEYVSDNTTIDFTATIDSDKKVITINPDSDFIHGEIVYVEIQALEDSSNNSMSSTSGTFSVTDTEPPTVSMNPAHGSTKVPLDTDVIIIFDEEIRLINNSEINNTNVDALLTVKDTNSSGDDLAFDAVINSNKTKITIDLVNDLSSEQTVYVAIGPTVEDSYDNALNAIHYGIFTAADKLPPTVDIEAVITASIATNSDITFTFSEAVRNLDDSALTNSNVGSLMTLKDTDANGADIPFVATINSAKTIITIDPVSNFTSKQKIYAAIGATVEDFENNVIPASSKTFTAEFLKEDLENPFNEKDVVALIDAQREISKRFIEQSSYAVLNRMEWLRRNRDVNNLSEQGIKFIFGDETFTDIATAFTFDKYINRTKDLFHNNWAFWSEGTVTLGEKDNTSLASLQEIQTTGITVGIDKKISDKKMYGFAFRVGHDNVDIGTADTNLKTDMFSLSTYATLPFNNNTFIDTHIGIGGLKIDSRRNHTAGNLEGNRNGKQVFGSFVYGGEFVKKDLNISPYGRVDLGYTILDEYLDSGKISALKYNEMKVETAKSSFGFLINNSLEMDNYNLKPFGRLEYGKGSVVSNDTIVSYYTAYPDTNYTYKGINEHSDNYRISVGADLDIGKNWFYSGSFERNEQIDGGNINTINFAGSYLMKKNAELSFNSNSSSDNIAHFSIQYDKQFNSGWALNYNIELQNSLNVSFESTIGIGITKNF